MRVFQAVASVSVKVALTLWWVLSSWQELVPPLATRKAATKHSLPYLLSADY